MKTVQDIITASGGFEKIQRAACAVGNDITWWAVKKWLKNGIPEKHWAVVMKLSGASLDEMFAANEALRAQAENAA